MTSELEAQWMEEINRLASLKGVRKIAVENFLLSTVDANERKDYALGNLALDAESYKWNTPTVEAIRRDINYYFDKVAPKKETVQ